MRTYLLAAVAAAAIASPAVARDGSGYVGVELGPMITEDTALDYSDDIQALDDAFTVDYNTGYDADIIGGYDFGMVRAEGELAYKRAGVSEVLFGPGVATNTSIAAEADGRMTALSAMGNVLLDFGDDDGWSGYIGGGVGVTKVKLRAEFSATFPTIPGTDFDFSDSDSGFAWQLIAGVRTRVTDKIDLGLKYRLFNVGKLEFGDAATDARLTGQLRTHSLLASLIYNFYTPPPPPEPAPPPPPPPPPPPATQTCPDGSVILATEACPVPPPPPPPPPPAPERG